MSASRRARPTLLTGIPFAQKDIFCAQDWLVHLRLENAGQFLRALRCPRDRAVQPCWRGEPGQDQHGRIRHGLEQRDFLLRQGQESVGREPGSRRQLRRLRCGGGGAPVPRGDRHGYRRLDSPARGAGRDYRPQADLRHGVALRHDRLRLLARSGRTHGQKRRGLRPDDECHGRFRQPRLDQPGTGKRRLHPRPESAA